MKKIVFILFLLGITMAYAKEPFEKEWWRYEEQWREDMRHQDDRWAAERRNRKLTNAIEQRPEIILPPPPVELSRLKSQVRSCEKRIAKLERAVRVLQKRGNEKRKHSEP